MTDEPFLIAHKVRGEAAFDIAIKQVCAICGGEGKEQGEFRENGFACDECDGVGYWWICSTSGHRAYPYWHHTLEHIHIAHLPDGNWVHGYTQHEGWDHLIPTMPESIPDHYRVNAAPRQKVAEAGRSLLAALGLTKPAPPIKRRI